MLRPKEQAVVVGVDGSEQSFTAARFGLQEAEALGCGVRLVHAYTPIQSDFWTDGPHIDLRQSGQRMLYEFAMALRRETTAATAIITTLCTGDPAGVLLRLSDEAPCVVVGRRRAGWLQHVLVHSVSARLSTRSHCPAVTISESCPRPGRGPVAVVVDSVRESAACLAYAADTARRWGTDVTVVHSAPLRRNEWPSDQDILAISATVETFRTSHPDVSFSTAVTNEPIGVAATQASRHAGLLVVSQSGSPNLLAWRRSGVRRILKSAHCPVAAVPPSSDADRTARRATRRRFTLPDW